METRRYRADDRPALVELHNAARADDHEFIPYTEAKLDDELQSAKSVWLATENDRLVGAAFYKPMWYGHEIVSFIAPDGEPSEIEAPLLDRVEADVDGDEAVIAVSSDKIERIAFLEARGYAADGGMVQLVTDLDEAREIPDLPPDYRIRALRPDESSDFVAMVNTAYDAERLSESTVDGWRESPNWTEEWVQVVEHQGRLAAGVVARPDRDYNDHFGADRSYLGPAAVLPDHGKQGLGRALTAASLNFVRSQGMSSASLYTTQGNVAVHRLTEQLGFWTAHRWTFMRKGL